MAPIHRLRTAHGTDLAVCHRPGRGPTILFLPGYRADMQGSKATALDAWCAARGQGFLRFDYSGCGESGGDFLSGTIGRWRDDALAVLDAAPEGKLVLVGSSMGGWIALLLALARPGRVLGLVGIAAAPDFTEDLMWDALAPAERAALLAAGRIDVPNGYEGSFPITLALIEDGRQHLLLRAPIGIDCPVRLLHGQRDAEVPWERAIRLLGQLAGADSRLVLLKDAEHRLSRPADLAVLFATLAELLGEDGSEALAVARI